jgi:hypothetical protein
MTLTSEALQSGSFFFADIERNQVDTTDLSVLRSLAQQGEGAVINREAFVDCAKQPEELDQALALLIRRELIEQVNGSYRFQIELIRRWFDQER